MRKVYGLLFILVLLLFTSCPSPGFNQTDSKEISAMITSLSKASYYIQLITLVIIAITKKATAGLSIPIQLFMI